MIDTANADLLLTTTRSVRKRLDLSRPVPIALIEECLSVALQAPTGGNVQRWRFVIVTDQVTKAAIADIYRKAWTAYLASSQIQYPPDDPRHDPHPRVVDSAQYLAEHLHEVPAYVIPCIEAKLDGLPLFAQATMLASVLPATWSLMLAARARGLGSTLTTLTTMHERQVSEILGIPASVTHCALVPLAYYQGESFRPAARLPIERVVYHDGWGRRNT
jgi:nitroreductase